MCTLVLGLGGKPGSAALVAAEDFLWGQEAEHRPAVSWAAPGPGPSSSTPLLEGMKRLGPEQTEQGRRVPASWGIHRSLPPPPQGLASCFGICAISHLDEALAKLEDFVRSDIFKKSVGLFSIFKVKNAEHSPVQLPGAPLAGVTVMEPQGARC